MTKCNITQQNKTRSFGLQGQLYWGGTNSFEFVPLLSTFGQEKRSDNEQAFDMLSTQGSLNDS